jgi:hypothetical protein
MRLWLAVDIAGDSEQEPRGITRDEASEALEEALESVELEAGDDVWYVTVRGVGHTAKEAQESVQTRKEILQGLRE